MLEKQITEAFLNAYKNKDGGVVDVLRMIKSSLTNRKVEKMISKDEELPDEEAISVLKSEAKKRQDSIESYRQGGRDDLADKEESELVIIRKFLPEQMSEDQVRELVIETIKEIGNQGPSGFGKIMGAVMAKSKGGADGTVVSKLVKEELSK
jgi:uncharacterized protein YqeY